MSDDKRTISRQKCKNFFKYILRFILLLIPIGILRAIQTTIFSSPQSTDVIMFGSLLWGGFYALSVFVSWKIIKHIVPITPVQPPKESNKPTLPDDMKLFRCTIGERYGNYPP